MGDLTPLTDNPVMSGTNAKKYVAVVGAGPAGMTNHSWGH